MLFVREEIQKYLATQQINTVSTVYELWPVLAFANSCEATSQSRGSFWDFSESK